MDKKVRNLGEFGSKQDAWDEAFNLSHIVSAANNANKGVRHELHVEQKGSKFTLWLMKK